MRDGHWLRFGLFAAAGIAGNVGLMMLGGFIPGPSGRWFGPVVGCMVLLSVQLLTMAHVVGALEKGRALA